MTDENTTYLVLRTSDKGLFNRYTRWRLHTQFPHAGIVVGTYLYHSTFLRGVHKVPFVNDGNWTLFKTKVDAKTIAQRFQNIKGLRYDWKGLLSFVIPFYTGLTKWLFCYEVAYYLLIEKFATEIVTPEILLCKVLNEK